MQRGRVQRPQPVGPQRPGGGQLADRVLADRAAAVDEDHPVGDLLQVGQDVAGDDHGPALPGQPAQQVAQLHPAARVQPGRRLVEQQHGRVVHERPDQPEPLLLPAGQAVHRRVRLLRQPGQLQQERGPVRPRRLRHPVRRRHHLEVLGAGEVVVQPEDVRRPAHPGPHLVGLGDRVEAGHPDLAGVRAEQRGEHQQQRRLARAVRPDERGDLPGRRVQVDALHGVHRAEGAPHTPRVHPGRRRHERRRAR